MRDGTREFEAHRRLLLSVAYQVLGDRAEAEDAVQEAWLRWDAADTSGVDDPRAYLVTTVTRVALNQLRRARVRRETYVGTWLPEPLPTGPDTASGAGEDLAEDVARADSVSMALLVVLETLSPLERAVFVLHEAFGFSAPEIAAALDRSDQAVRQLLHRARGHVRARRPRFSGDREAQRAVTERFLAAALGGDLAELLAVLSPEVTLWADAAGQPGAPRRPVRGADRVARLLRKGAGKFPPDIRARRLDLNGQPAALLVTSGGPLAAFVIDVTAARPHRAAAIHLVANPDKLARLGRDR